MVTTKLQLAQSSQYEETVGPSLRVDQRSQRIYAIKVSNSGKKPLTNVVVDISGPDSTLHAHAAQQATGVDISAQETDNGVRYIATRLHTGETFSISILFAAPNNNAAPVIAVRSDETLGTQSDPESQDDRDIRDSVIGAALSMGAVFLMALSVVFRRGPIFSTLSKLAGKQDAMFYIGARLRIPNLTEEMQSADTTLTYIRMGDLLLAHGLTNEHEERRTVIKALKCLLIIRQISKESLTAIKRNLQLLEGDQFSEDEYCALRGAAISIAQQNDLRSLIDDLVEGQERFAPETPGLALNSGA